MRTGGFVYGPAWSVDLVAALLLSTVAYCSVRLTFLLVTRRPDRRDIHVVHVVMGSVMAAMVLNIFQLGPSGAWLVVFASFAGWFLWRSVSVVRISSSAWQAVHESNHVVTSVAMVAMFTGGMVLHGGSMAAMPGMVGMSGEPGWFLPAAVFFAVAMTGYGIWNVALIVTMSAPALTVHQGCASSSSARVPIGRSPSYTAVTTPRLALCCDVAMAISMVYMFAWVH